MCALKNSWNSTFQLRITLRDVAPLVWRRLVVPGETPLDVVHAIFQIAFGWTDSHLHEFTVGSVHFGMADVAEDLLVVDEAAAPLGAVAREGTVFTYTYDFGDDWRHDVLVERVDEEGYDVQLGCLDGARACPPEDCGGPPGYARLLEALSDPDHEEHHDMRRWVGRRFEPERFDAAVVNRKLAPIAKRMARSRRRAAHR